MMQEREPRTWKTPEFVLVVIMLIVFTALVIAVLFMPLTIPEGDTDTRLMDLLDFRKNILAVLITAFGAWVGAGAAYFFGRENLREAANSLLAMRELSPRERLRRTLLREMPLRPIDWTVKTSDDLKVAIDKLKAEPERWFIPFVQDDGSLETIIHEQAVWRFVDKESAAGTAYDEILQKKVSHLLDYVKGTPSLARDAQIYVSMTLDRSASDAHDLMQQRGVYLAVITDEKGRPTQYMTTGDLRTVLLQVS
jgi:hypothetical protein